MKKRNFAVRIFCMVLAILMLLSITACGNKEEDTDISETEVTTSSDPEKVFPEADYGGSDFIMLIRKDDQWVKDCFIEELNTESTSVDKAVYSRNAMIEDQFNINFVVVKGSSSHVSGNVSKVVLAESNTYDLVVNHGRNAFKDAMSGFCVDWNTLEHTDLTGEWWAQSAVEQWKTPSGGLYLMNGDISYLATGYAMGMFFNKRVIDDAKIKSPYEYVKEDNWTMDTFFQAVKDADASITGGDGSGTLETDTFGYLCQTWRGPVAAMYSAGNATFELRNDGKYDIGIENERTVYAVDKFRDFVFNGGASYFLDSTSSGVGRPYFTRGDVVFFDDCIHSAYNFKDTIDFGIVPWPKYEQDDEYVSLVTAGTNTFEILNNCSEDNLERISLIVEAMAYYGYKDVVPYYFETVLSYQSAKDENSAENLRIIYEHLYFDLGQYGNFGNIGNAGVYIYNDFSKYGTSLGTSITSLRENTMLELEVWSNLGK